MWKLSVKVVTRFVVFITLKILCNSKQFLNSLFVFVLKYNIVVILKTYNFGICLEVKWIRVLMKNFYSWMGVVEFYNIKVKNG